MAEARRVFVNIYVQVFGEAFSRQMVNRMATGDELYAFLMGDAGLCWHFEESRFLTGDCTLWYLGACEHHGCLMYHDRIWFWNHGEASFDIVEAFVRSIHEDGLFTAEQHQNLISKINQGRRFKKVHDINLHLVAQGKESSKHVV